MTLALSDGKVNLRLLDEDDLTTTLAWRNKAEIRQWFFNSNIIEPIDHLIWYENYKRRGNDFVFIIEEAGTKKPIGQVSIYNIDYQTHTAEFGRLMIGEMSARGKGFAHAATKLLTDMAFANWDIQEIMLSTMATNIPAIRIYEKCGFATYAIEPVGIVKMRRCVNG